VIDSGTKHRSIKELGAIFERAVSDLLEQNLMWLVVCKGFAAKSVWC
jgi:hypothetical protein